MSVHMEGGGDCGQCLFLCRGRGPSLLSPPQQKLAPSLNFWLPHTPTHPSYLHHLWWEGAKLSTGKKREGLEDIKMGEEKFPLPQILQDH